MALDLQSIQIAVGIAVGLLTVLGTVFGWFGKVYRWVSGVFKAKPSGGTINVPTKTLIVMPAVRGNVLWWHMGGSNNQPAMQIVGDLTATNISQYGVYVMGAKLRKPKAIGHALVRAHESNTYSPGHVIPQRAVTELRFDFFVQPPVCAAGKAFKGDVAIVDQFGNEHWLKNLTFPYH